MFLVIWQIKTTAKDMAESGPDDSLSKTSSDDIKVLTHVIESLKCKW